MTDIQLGQSIAGSITSSDLKDADGNFYDEYNIKLADNRAATFALELPPSAPAMSFNIINSAGDSYLSSYPGGASTIQLVFQADDYKLRVYSSKLGNYKLSTTDDGRITSSISSFPASSNGRQSDIGYITDTGKYISGFDLGKGREFLLDVAIASITSNYALYAIGVDGFGGTYLRSVGKKVADATSGVIKDIQGNKLLGNINSLAVTDEDKIYTIESTGTPFRGLSQDKLFLVGNSIASSGATQDKLYAVNPANNVASLIGNLPVGFLSSGDLIYDASTKSFFATSVDLPNSDALWKIPLANPAGASKVGSIGFTNITGLSFDGGKLIGFNNNVVGSTSNQLSINMTSGAGTIERVLSGISDITGAASIPTLLPAIVPTLNSITDFKKDPTKYMGSIRDYDGNKLGGDSSWKLLGDVDIQGDGDLESILVNPAIGRFASVGSVNGNVDFSKYGLNGDTRVVGIYIDPTLKNSPQNIGGPFDSQRRFQNDVQKDNLKLLAAGDYNNDGFQDLYFKLGDGTAVLRALMFKDGNIQYANYQSKSDLTAFMAANNVDSAVWGSWI